MADRPVLMLKTIPGGGMAFYVEFPPGVEPGPVIISEAHKQDAIIELTGGSPITDGWVRIPATYAGRS